MLGGGGGSKRRRGGGGKPIETEPSKSSFQSLRILKRIPEGIEGGGGAFKDGRK